MARAAVMGRCLLAGLLAAALAACGTAGGPAPAASGRAAPAAPSPVPSPTSRAAPVPPAVSVEALTGVSPSSTGPGAYQYRVEVPRLEGVGTRAQAIDAIIRSTLQRALDGFLDEARAAGPEARKPSDLSCTSRTVRAAVRLVVLRVDCSERLAGTDRPAASSMTFNCDLAAGRILSLQDLFGAGSRYLDVLSSAARAQLRSRLPASEERALDDSTTPVVDNFRTFLLDRAALVLVLTGRFAAGQVEVSVPYADLQRYLAPGVTDLIQA
jgi:hypothetical protein